MTGGRSGIALLFHFAFQRPLLSLATAGILLAVCAPGIPRLRTEPALESLTNADLPAVRFHKEVRANFQHSANMVVVARGTEIFSAESVELLRRFESDLSSLEGVEKVQSLFSVPVLVETRHGNLVEPLLRNPNPDPEFLAYAREKAIDSPLLRDHFVNTDATATSLALTISNPEVYPEKAKTAAEEIVRLVDQANSTAEPELRFYELGFPSGNAELLDLLRKDTLLLVPVAFLVVGATIFFFYRSWIAVLLPLLTGSLSILSTLGLMGYADIPINILLYTIALLILVLGCTEDLHLLSEYREGIRDGLTEEQIFHRLARFTGRALFLTSLTTFLGFVSIAFTPLESLRDFAISLAAAMVLNFFFTALVVPAILRLLPRSSSFRKENRKGTSLPDGLIPSILRRRGRISVLFGAFFLLFLVGASRLEVDTDVLNFFPGDSRTRVHQEMFRSDFGGSASFVVVVETHQPDGVFDPDVEKGLEEFQAGLERSFDGVLGFADPRREFRPIRTEIESAAFAGVASPDAFMRPNFVDFDASRAAFYLRTDNRSSRHLRESEESINALASRILPEHCSVGITGERIVLAKLSDSVSKQLLINLGILAVITAVSIAIFLKSTLLGFLSILPNAFPVIATFGLMGWLGFPFSIGTFPVVIIAFALAVDDTIHLLARFSTLARTETKNVNHSLRALREETHPVLATSVTLCLGYLVVTASEIPLHREISLLFTFAVLMALLADLLLTPTLLLSIEEKYRAKFANPRVD